MNNFSVDELIIIIKEIISTKKEEELFGLDMEENYNFPYNIKVKLENLSNNDYISLFDSLEKIANKVIVNYNSELNSLNLLHEEILDELNKLKTLDINI
ncbi:hypothetical protein BH721_00675 [Clostridium baratii]|uniref:Uncharacterized protein n=1 Tax=Clostridium baratii TaxID=1561 RepID=A0A174QGA6_9CLOT|nr:hypothetical protein [Clostridium baratii]OPF51672.1 hypothetical protein A1M12_03800 [Clostridium baratii]OPF55255.1 hypothetical protein BH721_00675 [Clostridium baratii]OPF57538.1 hypothetical protein BH724_07930 [Clostridium baratii]OPF60364.1 hypothetical protein BH725_07250 [Clostridium baratii]CUP71001.1 Uncharacterised protein [Clostridium baratii]